MLRYVCACLGAIFFAAVPLLGSSVLQVGFKELVQSSELIFEGRVVDKRSEMDARGNISTYVTFEVQNVLKGGESRGSLIVLHYLGGTIGGLTQTISDLVYPDLGERGIYFVESATRRMIQPLYGWDQGHFLVTNGADGVDRVLTHTLKPVAGIEAIPTKANNLSNGVAFGVLTIETNRQMEALTVSQFRLKVLAIAAQR